MIILGIRKVLNYLGYELHRMVLIPQEHRARVPNVQPAPIDPIWPLPLRSGGPSDKAIRKEFARYDLWHYTYEFEGGLSFQLVTIIRVLPMRPSGLCSVFGTLCRI